MSLIVRKKRPLTRDASSLRDDRHFFVACDDTYAPKQYFGFFRLTRVHVEVVPAINGRCAARDVLKRLLEFSKRFQPEQDDELWMLLDADHYTQGRHLRSFIATLKRAKGLGVNLALSKPCFELWLLLHHQIETAAAPLLDANEVVETLSATLGTYNKTELKQEDYPLTAVASAIERAERLDTSVTGGDIPQQNTTRVYLLWKALVSKSLQSQIPTELRNI